MSITAKETKLSKKEITAICNAVATYLDWEDDNKNIKNVTGLTDDKLRFAIRKLKIQKL